jgi:Integrase core domain
VLFGKRCAKAGIDVSIGSVGDCYDNAVCETFHASLKKVRIYRQSWPTRTAARTAIFTYIEGWYNPRRRHSTLDYLSPVEFERQHAELAQPAFETPKSGNGSVASTSPRAGLQRVESRRTASISVPTAPIAPRKRARVPSGPARAAPDAVQGPTAHRRPLRPVVKEQAR